MLPVARNTTRNKFGTVTTSTCVLVIKIKADLLEMAFAISHYIYATRDLLIGFALGRYAYSSIALLSTFAAGPTGFSANRQHLILFHNHPDQLPTGGTTTISVQIIVT